MPGPCGVITVVGSFQDAYEYERLAIEQAQWDLILYESKPTDKTKQEASSETPRCSPRSPEHRLMPETSASVLPPDSMVSASPATLVPQKVPDLPEEAKPKEGKHDSTAKDNPTTRA